MQNRLTGEPRTATVVALEPLEVLRVTREDFDEELQSGVWPGSFLRALAAILQYGDYKALLDSYSASSAKCSRCVVTCPIYQVTRAPRDIPCYRAGLLLALRALSKGKQALISRGELVEIGGSFRMPDVFEASGAILREVGTTNRTYARDYEAAIDEDTAALMRVHRSNFRLLGFVHEPSLAEMVALAEERDLYLFDDLGSGTLLDTAPYGLAHEPTIQESVAAGASLVSCSGDKLLGGPQAGLILGRAELIVRLKRFPLTRALRVDKTTLAGLQATLRHYLLGEAADKVPVWRMISQDETTLNRRARSWVPRFM